MGRTYSRLLRLVPRSLRSKIDESVRSVVRPRTGARPGLLEKDGLRLEPWKYGARSAVCISADFELAWASQAVSLERALDEGARTRRYLPLLLETFDRFRIPVTWAAVGHLFLEQCDREGGLAHPNLPRPPPYRNRYWSYGGGDWYQNDPCTSRNASPEWYALDLLDAITAARAPHEIGCHSFSHTDFSDANCPPEVAGAELERCQREAARRGIRLRSFVFPGNFEGNFTALREAGFVAYRGSTGPELCYPVKEHGLWNLRGSLQLFDPVVEYSVRLERYLDAASRTQTCCHLNFHPSEPDPIAVESVLVPALTHLRAREGRGDLWVGTMGEIAAFCEARTSAAVRSTGRWAWEVEWRVPMDSFPAAAVTVSIPWTASEPEFTVDGAVVPGPSRDCEVRNGRLFLTVSAPRRSFGLRRR